MSPRGTLEVTLLSGSNVNVGNINPHCIISYKDQQKTSNTAECQGSDTSWDETFLFTIAGSIDELRIKIIDMDEYECDEDVGECIIPLDRLLESGYEAILDPEPYDVIKQGEVYGELAVGLKFIPEADYDNVEYEEEHDCE
ncbi:hypothetical protein M0R45_024462 [Rubus argutus]|uniref:C2 domain-containing protein n=1 Tax=Rubus argutus TaxID=59490 RepID=A0AAW1WVG3_RUBAR